MVRYSPELKAEIIGKYNHGMATSGQLAREHDLNSRVIRSRIQIYRLQGKIQHSRNKRIFDTDFKVHGEINPIFFETCLLSEGHHPLNRCSP